MFTKAVAVRRELREVADPAKAQVLQRFFQTGPGGYGEGDRFLGVTVGVQRQIARSARELPLNEVAKLLGSPIHEERLVALLILVEQFERGDTRARDQVYWFYARHVRWINNWDLVDLSAPKIVGPWFQERDRGPLHRWVNLPDLWRRRIAVLATFHFIRQNDFTDILAMAARRLSDRHDLIHKAVGWMLREVGKRQIDVLKGFLDHHAVAMPRTMLRYAIEKLPEEERRGYLKRR